MTETPTPRAVYRAIAAVSAEIAKSGIAKERKNQQQGYTFRGIDDCYNALAPILASHGLCILPVVEERAVVERETRSGGALFYTTVRVRFTFVAAEDGSAHDVVTYGEAMDSADKSTNKAMSAAYKYAVMQAFCIPTEGDHDTETATPEVKAAKKPPKPRAEPLAPASPPSAPPAAAGRVRFKIRGRDVETAGILMPTLLALWDALKEIDKRDGQNAGKAWLAAEGYESSLELTDEQGRAVIRKALGELKGGTV